MTPLFANPVTDTHDSYVCYKLAKNLPNYILAMYVSIQYRLNYHYQCPDKFCASYVSAHHTLLVIAT